MGEHRRDPNGGPPEGHLRARELLGPYLLGALEPDEEEIVERHLAGCAACREEERELRETHERLAGVSIAAPPDLKRRILAALPPHDGGEAVSGAPRLASRVSRFAAAAAAVLLLIVLAAVAYSAGFLNQRVTTVALAPTELAPGASGELKVQNLGPNAEASLEVRGLPRTGPDEYYELWFGKEGGRVSAGTFTVDQEGRCSGFSGSTPEFDGEYQRVGITLEKFPEEPNISSARAVLRGDLQGA